MSYDPATGSRIARLPLVADPWERARVRPGPSAIPGSGEGLFARTALPAGALVSFYNGTRPLAAVVDRRAWSLNGNAITVVDNEKTCVDVPPPFDATTHYCASLSHKANHCFAPGAVNATFELFVHPRFGKLKAMRLLRPLRAGEEIFVDYGYPRTGRHGPGWYRAALAAAGPAAADAAAAAAEAAAAALGEAAVDLRRVDARALPLGARAALVAHGLAQ
jgi:histone-lysine N-methyltransferase SETD7